MQNLDSDPNLNNINTKILILCSDNCFIQIIKTKCNLGVKIQNKIPKTQQISKAKNNNNNNNSNKSNKLNKKIFSKNKIKNKNNYEIDVILMIYFYIIII